VRPELVLIRALKAEDHVRRAEEEQEEGEPVRMRPADDRGHPHEEPPGDDDEHDGSAQCPEVRSDDQADPLSEVEGASVVRLKRERTVAHEREHGLRAREPARDPEEQDDGVDDEARHEAPWAGICERPRRDGQEDG
jgi:hypothetical protein